MSDEVLRTLIITLGSVLTAGLGVYGTYLGIRRQRRKRRSETSEEERVAVAEYMADPGQWVKDVVASNKDYAEEVRKLRKELGDMRRKFDERDREERSRIVAMARWVARIFDAWPANEGDMPYPEGDDARILSEVIPAALEATRPRRHRSTPPRTEEYGT